MSTFTVSIETITVSPHPNADRLELAQVGLYNVVIPAGVYSSGDKVFYIPEFAVLPDGLIETLGLTGKLGGKQHNRVTPIKLRGELSQGIVASLDVVPVSVVEQLGEGADFADTLGITKWTPEVPASMSGEVQGNSDLIPWVDVENLKKFPDMFTPGEIVIVDEKIHGTSTLVSVLDPLGVADVLVSSKGLGEKRLTLVESDSVIYWRVLNQYPIVDLARVVAENITGVVKVGIFGETFGSKVQDLHYGSVGVLGYRVFDVFVELENSNGNRWLSPAELEKYAGVTGVPLIPRLFEGPFDMATVAALASGLEQVSGDELHIREGVVVRPADRGEGYHAGAQRIGKYVSEAYLTRKGGTEYQ